jgi:hypothetical protein
VITTRLRLELGRVLPRAAALACLVVSPPPAHGYSVLTHQTIVDAVWDTDLAPAIRARFPHLSADMLRVAHAYAYGGCIIQDMGYYPFGSRLFTDLAHYVRSGDFVEALLKHAEDANGYAFALGALALYAADGVGHPAGINRAVPLLYPELARRFGARITYEQSPGAHVKTEFGLDVAQVAKGDFAPSAYHDFIGFEVAKPLLERAFEETYGLPLKELFASEDLAIGSYRHAVSSLIPTATKIAWQLKEKEIVAATPGMTREKFVQNISRASYEKEWGTEYERPGTIDKILGFLFRLIPKIGPLKGLSFKAPTPEVERIYMESFNRTISTYRGLLREVQSHSLHLADRDLDTGEPTRAGDYALADRAFARLLHRLAERHFEGVTAPLRASIVTFFESVRQPADEDADRGSKQTRADLQALKEADLARR